LLQKFLQIISKFVSLNPLRGKEHLLAKLNPDRFYVENVRALLGVSTRTAQLICDSAVRQGAFNRYIAVLCPDKNIGASAEDEAKLPEYVLCTIEQDGEYEQVVLPTNTLERISFYQLSKEERVPEINEKPTRRIFRSSAQDI
jgi:hypothetical protein